MASNLGYSESLFGSSAFFDALPLDLVSSIGGCAEPTCSSKCYSCNNGCSNGPSSSK